LRFSRTQITTTIAPTLVVQATMVVVAAEVVVVVVVVVVEEEEEEEEEEEKEKEVVVVAVAAAVASTQWSDCAYGFQRALPWSAFVTLWSSSCSPMPPTPTTSACLCGPLR